MRRAGTRTGVVWSRRSEYFGRHRLNRIRVGTSRKVASDGTTGTKRSGDGQLIQKSGRSKAAQASFDSGAKTSDGRAARAASSIARRLAGGSLRRYGKSWSLQNPAALAPSENTLRSSPAGKNGGFLAARSTSG